MALTLFRIIQDLVASGNYVISRHAMVEAVADDLHLVDIEAAILTGRLTHVQRGDARGPKYAIVGVAADRFRRVGVIARLSSQRQCVIITVYELKEE